MRGGNVQQQTGRAFASTRPCCEMDSLTGCGGLAPRLSEGVGKARFRRSERPAAFAAGPPACLRRAGGSGLRIGRNPLLFRQFFGRKTLTFLLTPCYYGMVVRSMRFSHALFARERQRKSGGARRTAADRTYAALNAEGGVAQMEEALLKQAGRRVVGTKQVLRAVEEEPGRARLSGQGRRRLHLPQAQCPVRGEACAGHRGGQHAGAGKALPGGRESGVRRRAQVRRGIPHSTIKTPGLRRFL